MSRPSISKITVVGFIIPDLRGFIGGRKNTDDRASFPLLYYLCGMRKLSMDELNRKSVDEFRESDKIPIIVVLDNIRSMHNVGSVFRTADAFLLQGIYLCGYTPQPPHRDIHKTALGATTRLPGSILAIPWRRCKRSATGVPHLGDRAGGK